MPCASSTSPSYLHADRLVIRPRGVRLFGAAAERKGSSVQLAFGGAYYGIVDVAELGMRVVPEQIESLTRAGAAITAALRRDHSPDAPDRCVARLRLRHHPRRQ